MSEVIFARRKAVLPPNAKGTLTRDENNLKVLYQNVVDLEYEQQAIIY